MKISRKKLEKASRSQKELKKFLKECKKENKQKEATILVQEIYRDNIRRRIVPEENFISLLERLKDVDPSLTQKLATVFATQVEVALSDKEKSEKILENLIIGLKHF